MSITLPMSLVSALSGVVLTAADAPPKFNAAAGCKAAAAIDQSMDLSVSQSYDSCMKDEERRTPTACPNLVKVHTAGQIALCRANRSWWEPELCRGTRMSSGDRWRK